MAAVVWATGFRSDYSWLGVPGVWDGRQVLQDHGASAVPGLWFIGLPWQRSRGSALLGFVGADAALIADQVQRGVRELAAQAAAGARS